MFPQNKTKTTTLNVGMTFILKLANFRNWLKLVKNKNKHISKCLRQMLMQFFVFISILLSPKSETYKRTKQSVGK